MFRSVRVADVAAVSQHKNGEVVEAFVDAAVEISSWGLGARGGSVFARSGSGLGSRVGGGDRLSGLAAGIQGAVPTRT